MNFLHQSVIFCALIANTPPGHSISFLPQNHNGKIIYSNIPAKCIKNGVMTCPQYTGQIGIPKDSPQKPKPAAKKQVQTPIITTPANNQIYRYLPTGYNKPEFIAKFGDPPQASPWDGNYIALKNHFDATAHNPDSIEIETCTIPLYHLTNGWAIACSIRGKNPLGHLVINSNWFFIQHRRVAKVAEFAEFRLPDSK